MKRGGLIHILQPTKDVLARTFCGVDPYRRNVQVQNFAGEAVRVHDANAPRCSRCKRELDLAMVRQKGIERLAKIVGDELRAQIHGVSMYDAARRLYDKGVRA